MSAPPRLRPHAPARRPARPAVHRILLLLAGAAVLPGCAHAARDAAQEADDAARHTAALAHVSAHNRSGFAVAVVYRPAAGPGGEVGIGSAAAGTLVELAPVPAGEPLIFIVRGLPDGELRLTPLSLELDTRRTLVVVADSAWWAG
ncbi:MAG: hypothetical protein WEB88_00225 [Gemmatimonadota bacterium]